MCGEAHVDEAGVDEWEGRGEGKAKEEEEKAEMRRMRETLTRLQAVKRVARGGREGGLGGRGITLLFSPSILKIKNVLLTVQVW